MGVLAALPLRLPGASGLLLAFSPMLLPALRLPWERGLAPARPRIQALFWCLGFLLALWRLPAPPIHGEVGELAGVWKESRTRQSMVFAGALRGRPGLLLRGIGMRTPAPGARFRGIGLALPGGEVRLLSWDAEKLESAAAFASRQAGPDSRRRRARSVCAVFPPAQRALARALLMGDRSALSWRQRCAFRNAGLAHLLALSGLHVGLFLLMARRLLTLLPWPPRQAEYLLLLLLPVLLLIWGSSASVVRALCMAAYLLIWRRRGGRPIAREALAASALSEFVFRPESLCGASFQLSYLATLALLSMGGSPPPQARWLRCRWALVRSLFASLRCTAAGLPVLLHSFGRLALLGPLWNVPAAMLCIPALAMGWLALPLSAVPVLGQTAAWPAAMILSALEKLALAAGGELALVEQAPAPSLLVWLPWSLGFRRLIAGRGGVLSALLLALPLAFWLRPPFS